MILKQPHLLTTPGSPDTLALLDFFLMIQLYIIYIDDIIVYDSFITFFAYCVSHPLECMFPKDRDLVCSFNEQVPISMPDTEQIYNKYLLN